MRKLYFKDRFIAICSGDDRPSDGRRAVEYTDETLPTPEEMTSAMEGDEGADCVCIISGDEDEAYRRVCAEFKEVDAGGGVVRNDRGDTLLIRRNGIWDLPKGHREEGEDMPQTALREVIEETGVSGLCAGELICITDHCYLRDGIWHLKHSWWYSMSGSCTSELKPQTEEDITEALWVAGPELPSYLENTYPSIREVFSNL